MGQHQRHDHYFSTLGSVRSTNHDCGCTKPLTLGLMALGFRSCTRNTQGASSTMISCTCASKRSRSRGSKAAAAASMRRSTSGLRYGMMLVDLGTTEALWKKRVKALKGSRKLYEAFIAPSGALSGC